jgi:hypothetical protein
MSPTLLAAVERLLDRIETDESRGGGLLARETLRCASELRLLVTRECRRRPPLNPQRPVMVDQEES